MFDVKVSTDHGEAWTIRIAADDEAQARRLTRHATGKRAKVEVAAAGEGANVPA